MKPANMTLPEQQSDPSALDTRRRRILYRAHHRGTQETDRLVGGFVSSRIAAMSAAELDRLEDVMALPDVDLADWLMGRRPIPPGRDAALLQAMREAGGR